MDIPHFVLELLSASFDIIARSRMTAQRSHDSLEDENSYEDVLAENKFPKTATVPDTQAHRCILLDQFNPSRVVWAVHPGVAVSRVLDQVGQPSRRVTLLVVGYQEDGQPPDQQVPEIKLILPHHLPFSETYRIYYYGNGHTDHT